MREILQLSVGQCGCQIGLKLWDQLMEEHAIDAEGQFKGDPNIQLDGANIYFNEISKGKFVPRTLFIDFDERSLNIAQVSPNSTLFNPSSFVCPQFPPGQSTGNNWAKGHYLQEEQGNSFLDNQIRRQLETYDSPQGIQITHALGGGTGSGYGTFLINKIREAYPQLILQTYTVYPHPHFEVQVNPYNVIMSQKNLIESVNMVQIFDNKALNELVFRSLKVSNPGIDDLNYLIAQVMSGITSTSRFSGQNNFDFNKINQQLVQFPRQHFFIPSLAPILTKGAVQNKQDSIENITESLFNYQNSMCTFDSREGLILTGLVQYRGKVNTKDAEQFIAQYAKNQSQDFSKQSSSNISIGYCDIAPRGLVKSGTLLQQNSAIRTLFETYGKFFTRMFRRKSFLHWYTGEGMDEMEFTEAEQNIKDLIQEYANSGDGQNENEEEEEEQGIQQDEQLDGGG